jgi:hypothetical protein
MSESQIPFLIELRDEVRRVAMAHTNAPRARRLRRVPARLPHHPGGARVALGWCWEKATCSPLVAWWPCRCHRVRPRSDRIRQAQRYRRR